MQESLGRNEKNIPVNELLKCNFSDVSAIIIFTFIIISTFR